MRGEETPHARAHCVAFVKILRTAQITMRTAQVSMRITQCTLHKLYEDRNFEAKKKKQPEAKRMKIQK